MSKTIYLTRSKSAIGMDRHQGHLIYSDSPLVRYEYSDSGYDVLGTHKLTNREFWQSVIELRDLYVAEFDINRFMEEHDLPKYLTPSLTFHLRFWVSEIVYELVLIDVISNKEKGELVLGADGFRLSEVMIAAKALLSSPTAAEARTFKKQVELKSKKFLQKYLRKFLFEVSLKWISVVNSGGVLAFSPNSGLGGALDLLLQDKLEKNSITYVKGHVGGVLDVESLKTKLKQSFLDRGSLDILCLPMAEHYGQLTYPETKLFLSKYNDICSGLTNKLELPTAESIQSYLRSKVEDWCLTINRDILASKKIVKAIKPSIYVAQHSLDLSSCLAVHCAEKGIPSLLISHGSHALNDDEEINTEWTAHAKTMIDGPFTYSAIQTPVALSFCSNANMSPQLIKSGPLIVRGLSCSFDQDKRETIFGRASNKIVMLHAGSPKSPECIRPLIYESTDEYVENIRKLVTTIGENENIHIAIRLRAGWGVNRKVLEAQLPDNGIWEIYEGGDFEDLLAQSDVLVSYSSTTIEQALFAGKSVMLWNTKNAYQHFSSSTLAGVEKGVWCATPSNLNNVLPEIVQWVSDGGAQPSVQSAFNDYAVNNSISIDTLKRAK